VLGDEVILRPAPGPQYEVCPGDEHRDSHSAMLSAFELKALLHHGRKHD
jgi:hypothetical protein